MKTEMVIDKCINNVYTLSKGGGAMQAVIKKWGNSLGLRFPQSIAKAEGISEGSIVEVLNTPQGITVKAVEKVTLESLFKNYKEPAFPEEVIFDENIGKEIW